MTAPNAILERHELRRLLSALGRDGAICAEDERLLLADHESLHRCEADAASTSGSRLNDSEYWSLRFVHDLSNALHRSGWIGGEAHAAGRADAFLMAEHERALCQRLASAVDTW